MMVPAIAFASWFACLPPQAPAATATVDESAEEGAASTDGDEESLEQAERVKPKLVSPAMVAAAESFINLPMGSERYATVGGKRYVFVLEQHYHPPGYVGGPTGYHKGVTMYELVSSR
jgi:hypothetical protein